MWSLLGTILILGFMVIVGIYKMQQADEHKHEMVAGEPEEIVLLFAAERDVRHGRTTGDEEEPPGGVVECA